MPQKLGYLAHHLNQTKKNRIHYFRAVFFSRDLKSSRSKSANRPLASALTCFREVFRGRFHDRHESNFHQPPSPQMTLARVFICRACHDLFHASSGEHTAKGCQRLTHERSPKECHHTILAHVEHMLTFIYLASSTLDIGHLAGRNNKILPVSPLGNLAPADVLQSRITPRSSGPAVCKYRQALVHSLWPDITLATTAPTWTMLSFQG